MQRLMKDLIVLVFAALAALYMINPTAGFLEFIPDAFPIIGNLDEATATLIIINALRYFGLDVSRLFGRGERETIQQQPSDRVYRPDSRR
jgi:uncharacterized membrane protein YkvA (DUF1232 family)